MSCRVDKILNKFRYQDACNKINLAKEATIALKASFMLDYFSGATEISSGTQEAYNILSSIISDNSSPSSPFTALALKQFYSSISELADCQQLYPVYIGIWTKLCGYLNGIYLVKSCSIGPVNNSLSTAVDVDPFTPLINVLNSDIWSPSNSPNALDYMTQLSVSVYDPDLPAENILKNGNTTCEALDCLISHLCFLAEYTSNDC
jgi:hypothetical protein